MDKKKKEPKYLDLSARAEVNLEELLQRLMPPKPSENPERGAEENDGNN